ncbi:MAG: 50S ribosomal protein L19e [Candidatus Micrarchaeia archaeon]
MSIQSVRRMASDILGVGTSRIRILPAEVKKASEALTRDDVRALIKQGIIYVLPKVSPSRARAKALHIQRKKGRRRGLGKRKGLKYARVARKTIWMNKVRAQRALLKELAASNKLVKGARRIYHMIKGMAFKSRASLLAYLKENNLVKGV